MFEGATGKLPDNHMAVDDLVVTGGVCSKWKIRRKVFRDHSDMHTGC